MRAILLLDPFASVPDCLVPPERPDLIGVFGGLMGAWEAHGRFFTSDILLAVDPKVFSRFLLTSSVVKDGRTVYGDGALATSGLAVFIGFMDRSLRAHDFMPGRENCRQS